MASPATSRKVCFVTVGATAPFDLLIRASVTPSFLQYLASQNYTDLLIQHGKDGDRLLRDLLPEAMFDISDPLVDPWAIVEGIKISRFDFRKEGLQREMLAARGSSLGYRIAGVVICHAGMLTAPQSSPQFPSPLPTSLPSTLLPFPVDCPNTTLGAGTILDGLRLSVPLVVVPNPSLLDNHQDELAEELARQGYVVHGKIDSPKGLEEAVAQSEARRTTQTAAWPPVNKGGAPEAATRGMAGVMDEEMGFLLD